MEMGAGQPPLRLAARRHPRLPERPRQGRLGTGLGRSDEPLARPGSLVQATAGLALNVVAGVGCIKAGWRMKGKPMVDLVERPTTVRNYKGMRKRLDR